MNLDPVRVDHDFYFWFNNYVNYINGQNFNVLWRYGLEHIVRMGKYSRIHLPYEKILNYYIWEYIAVKLLKFCQSLFSINMKILDKTRLTSIRGVAPPIWIYIYENCVYLFVDLFVGLKSIKG